MRLFMLFAAAGCLLLAPVDVMALSVVPEAEWKAALQQLAAGTPTKTSGIAALKKLGTVELEGEFDSVKGRVLRTREIVFDPGAVVALHKHLRQPGVAYIAAPAARFVGPGHGSPFVRAGTRRGPPRWRGGTPAVVRDGPPSVI